MEREKRGMEARKYLISGDHSIRNKSMSMREERRRKCLPVFSLSRRSRSVLRVAAQKIHTHPPARI
jgi:hypothetical protein